MWFNKTKKTIESEEYLVLKKEINLLKLTIDSLILDLEMYKKKLKISKGLKKEEESETETYINPVILPT